MAGFSLKMDTSQAPALPIEQDSNGEWKVAAAALGASLIGGSVALAGTAEADGLDDLDEGMDTIDGMTDTAVGIAVTVILFTAGAMVIKRLIWA